MWYYTTLDYKIDYFFYYSNWGNLFTTVVFWLLLFSHRPSRSEKYHGSVLDFFEVVVAMEYLINILYWSLLFDQLIMSGIMFNYTKKIRYYSYMFFIYGFVNYAGFCYLGQPVYYFLPFNDFKTIFIIFTILILQTTVYITLATFNNRVLKKYLVIQESQKIIKIE
eukprot:403373549